MATIISRPSKLIHSVNLDIHPFFVSGVGFVMCSFWSGF